MTSGPATGAAEGTARWELVREFGLSYGARDGIALPLDLRWPVVFEAMPGMGFLLVDEYPDVALTPQTDCRTIVLSPSHEVLFHSKQQGIDNGYGCLMDAGRFAILARPRREIIVFSAGGSRLARLALPEISPHRPRILTWTAQGTFLLTFIRPGPAWDLAEIDLQGHIVRRLVGSETSDGLPASVQLLDSGRVLIANESRHVIQEVGFDGSVRTRWGCWNRPGRAPGQLFNPKWARQGTDGTLLIADGHNQRGVIVSAEGKERGLAPTDRSFSVLTFLSPSTKGGYRACDAGLRCVFELDDEGRVLRQLGDEPPRICELSFPRSVDCLPDGRYLVADTANDRIVAWDPGGLREWPVAAGERLYWPRSARGTPEGTLLVTDALNSRVVELDREGRLLHRLAAIRIGARRVAFADPHDARRLPNGHLLVTDSAIDLVCETDWEGNAAWCAGPGDRSPLRDPHSAQASGDGRILVSDSGNDRIAWLDPRGGTVAPIHGHGAGRLIYPRYSERTADGLLLVVDSHNNRVIALDAAGTLQWEFASVPDSPLQKLHFPRWAHCPAPGELVVSDHFQHRIVHVRLA